MESNSAQRKWQGSFGAGEVRSNRVIEDCTSERSYSEIQTEDGKTLDVSDFNFMRDKINLIAKTFESQEPIVEVVGKAFVQRDSL